MCDLLIVAAVNITFLMVTGFVSNVLNFGAWSNQLLAGMTLIFGSVWSIGYFAFSWTLTGQTLGMALLGVRVVSTSGSYITLWRAVLRYFSLYLSAILLLGYFWVLIDDRRQGFHDKIARTFVVYTWPAPKTATAHFYRQRGDFLHAGCSADQMQPPGPMNPSATTQVAPPPAQGTQVQSQRST
ncbi:MAG: RDD family protein [Anaerolineales bacterium]|nr:RDD family protein [Anaerolineales bacterium]